MQDMNGIILEKVAQRGCGIFTRGAIPHCLGKILSSLVYLQGSLTTKMFLCFHNTKTESSADINKVIR